MKLKQLLNYYTPEEIPLDEEARQRILAAAMEKLPAEKCRKRRIPVGVLIAAVCILLLSVTAGAVGYSLWDAARTDAVLDGKEIPEYAEYENQTGSGSHGSVTLVSSLCAGRQLSVYVQLCPVTQEMMDTNPVFPLQEWDMYMEPIWTAEAAAWDWETQMTTYDGMTGGGEVLDYDAENQTALVNFTVNNGPFLYCDGAELTFTWYQPDEPEPGTDTRSHPDEVLENWIPKDPELWDYGTLTVPITQAESLGFDTETVVENVQIDGEATVTAAELWAGYLELTVSADSLEDWCAAHGGGKEAWFLIGDAVEGDRAEAYGYGRATEYDLEDAQSYYPESWIDSLEAMLQESYVTMRDGSRVSLSDVHPTGGRVSTEAVWSVCYELKKALELAEVESLTLGGVTYPKP